MTGCCPFCGAEYALAEAKCWDCKVSLESAPAPTLGDESADDDEVLYEVDDWPVEARVKLTAVLVERAVPYRWEPGLTLAVRAADDELAENILDELEEQFGGDADWDDEGDEDDDGEGHVSDAVAQAAMADLFVAADRLMHEPSDEDLAGDLAEAGTIVEASTPPFGIEAGLWDKVRELSSVVRGDIDAGADDEVVVQDARTLRDVLRPLV